MIMNVAVAEAEYPRLSRRRRPLFPHFLFLLILDGAITSSFCSNNDPELRVAGVSVQLVGLVTDMDSLSKGNSVSTICPFPPLPNTISLFL